VAQRYELNPNVVFAWRRLYRAGEFGKPTQGGAELIPVKVIAPDPGPKRVAERSGASTTQSDSIEVRLAEGAQVRFSGTLAREALREIIAAVFAR
jgi:transposase-like protein